MYFESIYKQTLNKKTENMLLQIKFRVNVKCLGNMKVNRLWLFH